LKERHESTDTEQEEAAEEAQDSKEDGAEEEAQDSNDAEATWHSSHLMPTLSCHREYLNLSLSLARILEEAAEEEDDSTDDSIDDSECRIDTDYTAEAQVQHVLQEVSSAQDTAERHAHLPHLDPETHLQTSKPLETLRLASGKRLLSAALLASAMRRRQSSVTTSQPPPDSASRAPLGTSFLSGGGVGGGGGKSDGEEAGRGRGGSNASAGESHAHAAHAAAVVALEEERAAGAAAPPSPRPAFTPTSSPRAKQEELCYMRVDVADGKAYPLESFLEVYGEDEGLVRWCVAAAAAQNPTAAADGEGELLKALPVKPTSSERECTPERSDDENGAVQQLQQALLQHAVLLPQDRPPITLASCTPAHPRMVLRSSKYSGSAGCGGGGMRGIELSARHNTSCNRDATELQQSCSSVGGLQGIELSARPGRQVVAKKAASSSITSPLAASPRSRSDTTPTSHRPPPTHTTTKHTPPTSDTPPASKWKQHTPVHTPVTVLYSHTPPTNDMPPKSHTPPQASGGGVSRSERGGGGGTITPVNNPLTMLTSPPVASPCTRTSATTPAATELQQSCNRAATASPRTRTRAATPPSVVRSTAKAQPAENTGATSPASLTSVASAARSTAKAQSFIASARRNTDVLQSALISTQCAEAPPAPPATRDIAHLNNLASPRNNTTPPAM
jgi:hypothetical protein